MYSTDTDCVGFQSALARTKEPYSCFECVHSKRHVALPPCFVGKVREGICEQLNKELNLYSTSLQGVLISYANIKLLQSSGVVMDDDPYIHFDIQVDFIVFKPHIGCRMKGIVNKTSVDHVGCLIYEHFNVSLPRPRVNGPMWRGSQLKLGDECVFNIDHIFSRNRVLSMKGQLDVSENDEACLTENPPVSEKKRKSRKRRAEETADEDTPHIKKHKKSKNNSDAIDDCVDDLVPEETVHIKKHKQSKKSSDSNDNYVDDLVPEETTHIKKHKKSKKNKK